jgi:colicin import membrane protein
MSTRRSLERAWVAALLLATAPVWSADVATERARIAQERAQVEARARADEAAWARAFAVAACSSQVRAQRRAALQQLDGQRALLDDAQRKQRAAERLERLRQRQDASARANPRPQVEIKSRADAPMPAASAAWPVQSDEPADLARRRAAASAVQARDADAARRAAAARERERKAAAHRAQVERRREAQALTKPAAAGLPVPQAASGAAR